MKTIPKIMVCGVVSMWLIVLLVLWGNSTQPGHQKAAAPEPSSKHLNYAIDAGSPSASPLVQQLIAAANGRAEKEKRLQSPKIQKRTDKIFKEHPEWGETLALQLAEGQTWVGMNVVMLHEAIGLPSHVDEEEIDGRKSHTLIYESDSGDSYYYFEGADYSDEVLTSIHRSH